LLIPAVLLSAWFGGVGPGLVAAALATFAMDFFLTEPRYSLHFGSFGDVVYLAAFAASAGLVGWVTGRQRNRALALRTAHDDLSARMKELAQTNERLETAARERRRAEAELAHVARSTMLGEITASIAHEVNQPLSAVLMSASAGRRWLSADPPDLDEVRDALERVVDNSTRASQVIRRIRSLLQRKAPERACVNVNDLVRETLALTQPELTRRDVSVRTELDEALPSTLGDPIALEQVLINLVLNGADAMREKSSVPRLLTIRSRADALANLVVEVRDCGMGLDPAHANRIFTPFFSTKPDGLGMGLAISRSIVEAHGGKIWAAPNSAGPGATLAFAIPIVRGAAGLDTRTKEDAVVAGMDAITYGEPASYQRTLATGSDL
jgi:C4-dicarboxylate-specific signal transduction histidine kinase